MEGSRRDACSLGWTQRGRVIAVYTKIEDRGIWEGFDAEATSSSGSLAITSPGMFISLTQKEDFSDALTPSK